ncbi:thiamine transporter [Entomoplasma freundtii]|uniref:Thiamine transporter n=1 Tax=Entomoplasma freundtii TaxID=74700 RepID=A0A2K8NQH5_9MOLU|nr:energy-coupled thiamine transporter ThiT [Entomoplasma freundtii]ATZ16090.1 thiamine transporter [Entomoplasma freundtii]TDY57009.1 thiamine transporter [Entomoplasma freundtii]
MAFEKVLETDDHQHIIIDKVSNEEPSSSTTILDKNINQPLPKVVKIASLCLLFGSFFIALTFFLCFLILTNQQFGTIFLKNVSPDSYQPIKISLLVICGLTMVFNGLHGISFLKLTTLTWQENRLQFIWLSFLGLNFVQLIITCYFLPKVKQKGLSNNLKIKSQKLFWNLGFRRWKTWDIAIIGLFTGLTILFTFLEGVTILPFLPMGGTVTFKYLMVMIIAFFHSFLGGFLVGGISALLALVMVPTNLIISPFSYLFDYFLPMISPAIVALMTFKIKPKKSFTELINYCLITMATFTLICFWQTISGYFVWVALYGPAWGSNGLVYAILANLVVSFGLNYPITQILVPPIFRIMSHLNWSKQTLSYGVED